MPRPLLMKLVGRSGMAWLPLFGLLVLMPFVLMSADPPPWWMVPSFLGWLALDCVGGVRIRDGSIRFRRYVRFAEVPIASVASVNAYRKTGPNGSFPVVTLKLHNGSKVRIDPMATPSMIQARNAARDVASMIGAAPPARNWDGT